MIFLLVACYDERLQEERMQSEMRVNRILSDLAMLGPLKCMKASAYCIGQKKGKNIVLPSNQTKNTNLLDHKYLGSELLLIFQA